MKKKIRISFAALLCLVLALTAVSASAGNQTGTQDPWYNMIHIDGFVYGTLNQRMATRTGPSTNFTEPGTFFKSGQQVKCISQAMDDGGVVWIQVEFEYRGALMRAYTGLKRLNVNTAKLVWENGFRDFVSIDCARLYNSEYGYTGPGYQYRRCDFKLSSSEEFYVVAEENGWYQLQTQDVKRGMIRCWVPIGDVIF